MIEGTVGSIPALEPVIAPRPDVVSIPYAHPPIRIEGVQSQYYAFGGPVLYADAGQFLRRTSGAGHTATEHEHPFTDTTEQLTPDVPSTFQRLLNAGGTDEESRRVAVVPRLVERPKVTEDDIDPVQGTSIRVTARDPYPNAPESIDLSRFDVNRVSMVLDLMNIPDSIRQQFNEAVHDSSNANNLRSERYTVNALSLVCSDVDEIKRLLLVSQAYPELYIDVYQGSLPVLCAVANRGGRVGQVAEHVMQGLAMIGMKERDTLIPTATIDAVLNSNRTEISVQELLTTVRHTGEFINPRYDSVSSIDTLRTMFRPEELNGSPLLQLLVSSIVTRQDQEREFQQAPARQRAEAEATIRSNEENRIRLETNNRITPASTMKDPIDTGAIDPDLVANTLQFMTVPSQTLHELVVALDRDNLPTEIADDGAIVVDLAFMSQDPNELRRLLLLSRSLPLVFDDIYTTINPVLDAIEREGNVGPVVNNMIRGLALIHDNRVYPDSDQTVSVNELLTSIRNTGEHVDDELFTVNSISELNKRLNRNDRKTSPLLCIAVESVASRERQRQNYARRDESRLEDELPPTLRRWRDIKDDVTIINPPQIGSSVTPLTQLTQPETPEPEPTPEPTPVEALIPTSYTNIALSFAENTILDNHIAGDVIIDRDTGARFEVIEQDRKKSLNELPISLTESGEVELDRLTPPVADDDRISGPQLLDFLHQRGRSDLAQYLVDTGQVASEIMNKSE